MSNGIYLRCESCGATLGGEQVTANPEPPLSRFNSRELRRRAAEHGWESDESADTDICPSCSEKRRHESF